MKMIGFEENILKYSAAVIRSYCNPDVEKSIKRALAAGFSHVYVMVNGEADNGSTRAIVENEVKDDRVEVIEMFRGSYSWSTALNRALEAINMDVLEGADIRFVVNLSVEVIYDHEAMKNLVWMVENRSLGAAGPLFKGSLNNNFYDLSKHPSYRHPRNTCMAMKLSVLNHVGGFSTWCDEIGGMEDIEFLLRMVLVTGLRCVVIEEIEMKLLLGKKYYQPQKVDREECAMEKIFMAWRLKFQHGSNRRKKIEQVISQFRLES